MNLERWAWVLCWALCLAFDQVDVVAVALSGMGRASTLLLDAGLALGYSALLVTAICRAVRDVDRQARAETRIATVRAVVNLLAARA